VLHGGSCGGWVVLPVVEVMKVQLHKSEIKHLIKDKKWKDVPEFLLIEVDDNWVQIHKGLKQKTRRKRLRKR